jgi:hypothetical protein
LIGKPEEKRLFERPGHRWEDIKIDVTEIWLDSVDRIHLTQDRGCCEHSNEPSGSVKGREFLNS